jgi:hypothetical protein
MENVAGEDLSWFWRGWFQYIGVLTAVNATSVVITVENFEKMPMPIILDVKTKVGR